MHLIVASVIKKWVLLTGGKNNINIIVTGEKGNTENIKKHLHKNNETSEIKGYEINWIQWYLASIMV